MAENSITTRNSGETITSDFFNDLKLALSGAFVGRNSSGVPEASQNLGSVATPWGVVRADSMVLGGQSIDADLIAAPANRVVSGKTRSSSNQPAYITPNGAALSLIIDATPTPLTLDINGADVSVAADITISSLTAAPSSNNTCLVDDTSAADQHDTRLWGEPEHRKIITIDTAGSEITALVGKYAAFMIDNGSATEYILAYVKSATELTQVRRGFFFDSSLNPKNRIVFSNNDTITLLKLGWIFVENNGTTADVTYTNPVWSFTSPGGPATGDYWYDLANSVWKRYDGASFQIINRTLVGMFCNTTAACVGARCIDFFARYDKLNEIVPLKFSTEIVKGSMTNQKVKVAGSYIDFGHSLPTWNITTDLATSADMYDASEQASRMYYLYITDTGDTMISDISPYFRADLFGEYHPHNPWRCVGLVYNNGSSNLMGASGATPASSNHTSVDTTNGYGSAGTITRRWVNDTSTGSDIVYVDDATNGSTFTCAWPGGYSISYHDNFGGSSALYLTKNAPDGATLNTPFLAAEPAAGIPGTASVVADLKIGDLVRTQTGAQPAATAAEAAVYFKRVS